MYGSGSAMGMSVTGVGCTVVVCAILAGGEIWCGVRAGAGCGDSMGGAVCGACTGIGVETGRGVDGIDLGGAGCGSGFIGGAEIGTG